MIDRRLHAVVTVALGLGVAYLGSKHYLGADRVQAPAVASRTDERPGTVVSRSAPADRGDADESPGSANVSVAILRQALAAVGSAEPQPAPAADGPVAQARSTLDERLLGGSQDPGQVARLERTVRALLVPSVLGEAVAEVRCSAKMCRVNLIGEDDAHVNGAVNAFAEHLPKEFASAVAYPDGAGHRSVYLGTSADDLKLSAEPPPTLKVEPDAATPL